MATSRKWTSQEWAEECRYISNATDKKGLLAEFNYDTEVFRRYCSMQRDAAERQGFHDSATYIEHCIDDLS